jgi:hypothetical protein
MDGYIDIKDCKTILQNVVKGAEEIYTIQKKALLDKYAVGEINE